MSLYDDVKNALLQVLGSSRIRIAFRRGTAAEWLQINPVLAEGEPGYETDTKKEKRGDGVTTWTGLSYLSDDIGNALSDVFITGRACSTDGSNSLPYPNGVGLEFVINADGLDDIRFDGRSL